MFLREFLYVDTEKVRSTLAQIEGGIEEDERSTSRKEKRTEGGVRGIASHYQNWGDERYINKSLGDALFPVLEDTLEAHSLLTDVSDRVSDLSSWTSGDIFTSLTPGSLVRITCEASLFDSRFVASSMAGMAATYMGITGFSGTGQSSSRQGTNRGSQARRSQGSQNRRNQQESRDEEPKNLEDVIPEYQLSDEVDFVPPSQLRAFVRIARGLFAPGLHMIFHPTDDDGIIIGARLQEGRQFLDSEPDILFARYGLARQEWTIVGIVGHHSISPDSEITFDDFGNEEGVKRANAAGSINSFIKFMGIAGFADIAQHPGFSMVPVAVYRRIGPPNSMDILPSP